jgi:hypothetical protein
MSGGALERSWSAWGWVGFLAAWGALVVTFGLCFGFGVVFTYFNGGLGSTFSFAQLGAFFGAVLGGLACGLYFASPTWLGVLTGLLVWFLLLGIGGMVVARAYRARQPGELTDPFPKPPPGTVSRGVFLVVWGLSIAGGIAACWIVAGGGTWAELSRGAFIGLLVSVPPAFYLGAVLAVLLERTGRLVFTLGTACLVLGMVGGALLASEQLDRLFGIVLAGSRGGVFGALGGMLTGLLVGLIGARFFPGRSHPGSFGGAMGAAFGLMPGPEPAAAASQFAGVVGIYPGAALGVWCGTVLGILGYLGQDRPDPVLYFTAAPIAGALLAVVFFGTRIVLQGAGTPRSGRGMLAVAAAGAIVGAIVAGVATVLATPVGSPEYWIAGMAGTGALIGAKSWEFFGGDAARPPLLPF